MLHLTHASKFDFVLFHTFSCDEFCTTSLRKKQLTFATMNEIEKMQVAQHSFSPFDL